MKTKRRIRVSALIATAILLTLVASCNVFENNNPIEGSWFEESPVNSAFEDSLNLKQRLELTFFSDYSFESARIVIDGSTEAILGYRFASGGRYSLLHDRLVMQTAESFYSDDLELYVPREELKPVTNVERLVIKFKVEGDRMTWIYPPCPENANCLGTQEFLRKVN